MQTSKLGLICLIGMSFGLQGFDVKNPSSYDSSFRFDHNHQAPQFQDPNRLESIRSVLPELTQIFDQFFEKEHLPGFSYGIIVDGELIYKGNYGFLDIEKKVPVTSSSFFRIASMTKSFIAMAILKLRDEGKLGLDDIIDRYLPELETLTYPTRDSAPLSIRHLLTMGAGFPEDNPWADRQLEKSNADLSEFLSRGVSFSTSPDSTFEYSNLSYALLGKIISSVTKQPYQTYIREHFLQPLNMLATEWEYSNIAPGDLAHGYRWLNDHWEEEALLHDKEDGSWGAIGGMITSVEEFSRYVAFHLSAWPPSNAEDKGVLKRSSLREMHQPSRWIGFDPVQNNNSAQNARAYGFGLEWKSDSDKKVSILHSGGLPGFGSKWVMMPDYGIALVTFANSTYADFDEISEQFLETLIAKANLQPRVTPPSPILQERKEQLLKFLPDWSESLDTSIFSVNFFSDLPLDLLRAETNTLYFQAGRILNVKEIVAENQLRGSFVLEGERLNLEVFFTLTPENPPLIQMFHIRTAAK